MFPFQPIDLSKLSYAAVLEVVAPFLPGGTIAIGWLCSHATVLSQLHDERILKIIAATFVVYVVGFVISFLTTFELGTVALLWLIRTTEIHEPWKNSEWRKVASKFLGTELSPPTDEPPSEPAKDPLPVTNAESLSKALQENWSKRMAPLTFRLQWQKWYEMLKARFPVPPNPQQAIASQYFSILTSIGWSGLIVSCLCPGRIVWPVWLACGLTILVSHVWFTLNLKQQLQPDPSGDQLAAEILKAIETRDLNSESRDHNAPIP